MKEDKFIAERDRLNAWFKRPKYRIWKYIIIGDATALFLLLLATIVFMDILSWNAVMIMRGCAGVLGIGFVVLAAMFYYLVYRDYIKHRFDPRNKKK